MTAKTNDLSSKLPSIHRALQRWYEANGRVHLPWRQTRDAYRIYISEIMLQQTQVKTVLERYYTPFLARFPTLAALAKAEREEVMKAWEGLGYYTRAANLHAAAQASGGKMPKTVEGLLALPGIGRNTAQAIACFAYDAAVPVMEANVKRVLARVFALRDPDAETLWARAGELLDAQNPFDYNQAMMDIGATVCTKRAPRCGVCPLSPICKGKTAPERYPAAKEAKVVPVRERDIVVFHDDKGQFYLARRKTRFLGGLYGFMEYEPGGGWASFAGKRYKLGAAHKLGALTQSYSHFTLQAQVYLMPVGSVPKLPGGFTRAALAAIEGLPLSRADRKIVLMLAAREG